MLRTEWYLQGRDGELKVEFKAFLHGRMSGFIAAGRALQSLNGATAAQITGTEQVIIKPERAGHWLLVTGVSDVHN